MESILRGFRAGAFRSACRLIAADRDQRECMQNPASSTRARLHGRDYTGATRHARAEAGPAQEHGSASGYTASPLEYRIWVFCPRTATCTINSTPTIIPETQWQKQTAVLDLPYFPHLLAALATHHCGAPASQPVVHETFHAFLRSVDRLRGGMSRSSGSWPFQKNNGP
jgi:hypothetical protein